MSSERDERYAEMLLSMGRADAQRMTRDPQGPHRSVALWVAHELAEQSRRLDIPAPLAESMRDIADQIRAERRPMPAPTPGMVGQDHDAKSSAA